MYQNYVFDLYGTLVDIHTDEESSMVWEKMALFYGYYGALYRPEELEDSYKSLVWDAQREYGDYISSKREFVSGRNMSHYNHEGNPEIQIERVFKQLFIKKGIQPDGKLVLHTGQFFRVLTTEYIRLYEGVNEMLEKLQKKEKRIYLLSNAQRIFTEYELHMLDIARYFDGILISSDYGIKKPDFRFFNILLEKYQLNPRESIMIGNDSLCDIAGAKKAGLNTYYIHSNISPEISSDIEATYVQMNMDIDKICRTLGF